MKYNHSLAEADTDKTAVTTAKILKKIAHIIESNIQMTHEVPENHQDGRIPVLGMGRKQ